MVNLGHGLGDHQHPGLTINLSQSTGPWPQVELQPLLQLASTTILTFSFLLPFLLLLFLLITSTPPPAPIENAPPPPLRSATAHLHRPTARARLDRRLRRRKQGPLPTRRFSPPHHPLFHLLLYHQHAPLLLFCPSSPNTQFGGRGFPEYKFFSVKKVKVN